MSLTEILFWALFLVVAFCLLFTVRICAALAIFEIDHTRPFWRSETLISILPYVIPALLAAAGIVLMAWRYPQLAHRFCFTAFCP